MRTYFICLLFLLATGCKETPVQIRDTSLNQEFTLSPGQHAFIPSESLFIQFHSVAEDSRCPTGVLCFVEGNARLLLQISKQGMTPFSGPINTSLQPKIIAFGPYELQLKKLTPYPKIGSDIPPSAYTATLVVIKG